LLFWKNDVKALKKRAGSGSILQWYGSADLDLHSKCQKSGTLLKSMIKYLNFKGKIGSRTDWIHNCDLRAIEYGENKLFS
jgi:hypothetical protein